MQLWQSQQQQLPQWKWQVQQLQVREPRPQSAERGLRARDLRQLDGGVPSDKVEQSLLKLQKIQQLDRLRRQR